MAELVDALVSGTSGRKAVRVRLSLSPQILFKESGHSLDYFRLYFL